MGKLKIYTADKYATLMKTDEGVLSRLIHPKNHHCPENCKSPTEQIEWVKDLLEKIKDSDECHTICTFSPYILNYLNLAIAKSDIAFDDIEVTEFLMTEDEEGEVIEENDLKIINEQMINTLSFSELILDIYKEYGKIRYNKDEESVRNPI